jgi:hypothetical protein
MALEVPAGMLARIGCEVGTHMDVDWDNKKVEFHD